MTGKGVFGGGSAMSVVLRAHREWGWRSSEPPQERVGALQMLGLSVLRLAALQIDREEVAEPKESHAGRCRLPNRERQRRQQLARADPSE